MKKFIKFKLFFALLFIFISAPILSCNAQIDVDKIMDQDTAFTDAAGYEEGDDAQIGQIIAKAIQTFLSLLGIVFVILLIYGGYSWMTAGGNEDKVTKAKETITRAIIGLVIVASAYSITYFVLTNMSAIGEGGGAETTAS